MCKTLVLVNVPIIKQIPYATGSGRLRFSTIGAASNESAPLYLRCGHGMTDQDRMDGYSPVDPFGRPILCDIHDTRR